MDIKGTAIKLTKEFFEEKLADLYDTWLEKLPEESKKIYSNIILTHKIYPLIEGQIIPIQEAEKYFFETEKEKIAYELGVDSAHRALTGIYKLFISIPNVSFVIKRAKLIFSTYFTEGKIELVEDTNSKKKFEITGFTEEESLMFYVIDGWIFGIFEIIKSGITQVTHIVEPIENSKFLKSVVTVKF